MLRYVLENGEGKFYKKWTWSPYNQYPTMESLWVDDINLATQYPTRGGAVRAAAPGRQNRTEHPTGTTVVEVELQLIRTSHIQEN